jgi:hypothetical protein
MSLPILTGSSRLGIEPKNAICVCVYDYSTYYKDVRVCGGGNNGGHVLRGSSNPTMAVPRS